MNTLLRIIPAIAWELSGKSVLRFFVLVTRLWYFAVSRKLHVSSSDFKIVGEYSGNPIIFYLRYVMDLAVLREVFIDKEYEWCPTSAPKTIIDLGAHFGDTALYYHARFPQAKIIAVEPSPETFARLQKHVQDIPEIIAVQAAIGSVDGKIVLNIGSSSLGNSIKERTSTTNSIEVSQISLPTLFQSNNIERADLIKFDIEGAESELFSNLLPEYYADAYIGELHLDLMSIEIDSFKETFSNFLHIQTKRIKDERFLFSCS